MNVKIINGNVEFRNSIVLKKDTELLFDYNHSRFLECNTQLAKKNLEKIGKKYIQNEKKNKMISVVTGHLSETLEKFEKHYWLAGGTLLGKFLFKILFNTIFIINFR